LARARERLRARLWRRGVTLPAGLLVAAVVRNVASASLPAPLVLATADAARGGAAAAGVPARVGALTEGVMKAMCRTQLKVAAGLLLVVACACAAAVAQVGAGPTSGPPRAGPPKKAPARERPQTDAERIRGAWKVVKSVCDGQERGEVRG